MRLRALECLARFGQRLRDFPSQRVRALATNTVRQLANPEAFLIPAETALGHAIEVVSGREEAAWSTSAWPMRSRPNRTSCGW